MSLFDRLDVEVTQAAERQATTPDDIRERLCRALSDAALEYFGRGHVFEARFENDQLRLAQIVRAKAYPSAPGEVATAYLKSNDLDVQHDDELMLEIPFTDGNQAAAQDRGWRWLSGLVTERSGFRGRAAEVVRSVLGIDSPRNPKVDAVRQAVLLAVLPAGVDPKRMRVVEGPHGGLQLRRSYTVGQNVSRDELLVLLERRDLLDGASFELFEDLVSTERLLVGIMDPDTRVIARAANACEVSEADLIAELKSVGLDLAQRKLEGRPWTQLDHAMKDTWSELKIVDQVRAEYGEVSLAHAKLIEPSLELGQTLKLPGVVERNACPDLVALFADEDTVRYIDTRPAPNFEAQRPSVATQPTPPALRDFELGPLRRLYPEDYGVLYADVAGTAALELWRKLDAAASTTGLRPVLLGGDARELREGMGAWSQDPHDGLQAGSHPNDSPEAVLGAVDQVDVKALLAPGGNPSYPNVMPERGEWPKEPAGDQVGALREPLSDATWRKVRIALVPTDAAWKTIAYLPMLLQAGEATPSLAQACAVSRVWEQQFGAKVISVRPATIEWWLDRQPSRSAALEVAWAHFTFTPEGGSDVLEVRANELVSPVWYAWWD